MADWWLQARKVNFKGAAGVVSRQPTQHLCIQVGYHLADRRGEAHRIQHQPGGYYDTRWVLGYPMGIRKPGGYADEQSPAQHRLGTRPAFWYPNRLLKPGRFWATEIHFFSACGSIKSKFRPKLQHYLKWSMHTHAIVKLSEQKLRA